MRSQLALGKLEKLTPRIEFFSVGSIHLGGLSYSVPPSIPFPSLLSLSIPIIRSRSTHTSSHISHTLPIHFYFVSSTSLRESSNEKRSRKCKSTRTFHFSVRSIMLKYLEKTGEIRFEKIFNQRMGFLLLKDYAENVSESACPQIKFYEAVSLFFQENQTGARRISG